LENTSLRHPAFVRDEGSMVHLDLDDLSLFRHIAEAGSITGGAGRAHLALAAASARLRAMEEAVGARLAERSRHGIALTPAGHTLLDHARTLLAAAERMQEAMGAYAGGRAGHIRMLSNTNALTEFLPEALGRFLAAHPQVTVDMQERLSDEIVGLVAEGVAELGIIAATADTGGLETYPFRIDRFVLVVPLGHPLAGRPWIDFADLLDLDFVGLDQASALQRFLAERAARIGVGIVPESTARGAARTLAIDAVPLADDWAVRELRLCVRALAALPPHTRLLVDHLRG
jgi:molybdate transport repressor ModE-like protein